MEIKIATGWIIWALFIVGAGIMLALDKPILAFIYFSVGLIVSFIINKGE